MTLEKPRSPSHKTRMTPSDETKALSPKQRHSASHRAMRRTWTWTGGFVALTALGLASCVPPAPEPAPPPPAPAPAPAPTPAPTPAAPIPADWMAQPLVSGDWHYVAGPTATRALFGPTASSALFTIACEPGARQVKLWQPVTAGSTATTMTIKTTEAARTLQTSYVDGAVPQVVTTLAPHDPILDAMIFTRGRLAVQVAGTETLYLPSWPEIARVVEDCR